MPLGEGVLFVIRQAGVDHARDGRVARQPRGDLRVAPVHERLQKYEEAVGKVEAERRDAFGLLHGQIAAISVGIYKGAPVLDLDYAEDSEAHTDANFVMTGSGDIVEVQGTAEKEPFSQEKFDQLMALARKGVAELVSLQKLTVT